MFSPKQIICGFLFCLLSTVCISTSARGDGLNYSLTGGGNIVTFQLPSQMPTPTGCTLIFGCGGSFGFIDLPVTLNGSALPNAEVDFSDIAYGGGMVIQTDGSWLVNLVVEPDLAQLYTGSLTNPTMLTGNFSLLNVSCPGCLPTELDGAFSLNVSTPEPNSLLLLSISILGLAGLRLKKLCLA